jgi:hypothetical protein
VATEPLAFRLQMPRLFRIPLQERYNLRESVLKKEIPVNRP